MSTIPNPTLVSAAPARTAKLVWAGRVVSALPVAMLLFSATLKFLPPSEQGIKMMDHIGWPMRYSVALGILELSCVILYLIPQTAVLGAILLTGYLGGATATHVRVGDPFIVPVLLGVLVWLGLYLRDARLRALLPLRNSLT